MYSRLVDASTGLFSGIFLAKLSASTSFQGLKPEQAQQQLDELLAKADASKTHWSGLLNTWLQLLAEEGQLETTVKRLDAFAAESKELAPYREYLFDLLYITWLSRQEEAGNTDWMDTPEWQRLEDKLAERGTELLTLLMYLQEVIDSNLKANLDDFLEQFITDDELDFQDDLEVYEEVIIHRDWLDLTYAEMVKKSEALEEETAIPEVFTPLFCFFKSPEKAQINLLATLAAGGRISRNLPVVLTLLLFYKGKESINPGQLLA